MRLSNGIRWLAVAAFLAMSGQLSAQSTASLVGRVTDDNGAGVSGVQVVVTNQNSGTQNGALSQSDGRFTVVGLRAGGPYRVEARMIGYGLEAVDDVMLSAGETRTIDFRLTQEAVAIDAIEVFATRAIERKTPVAYTDVPKVQIQNQLGSQDLPMVLNVTPSVYATMQGGGAGDARINVRGFDQKNTAVMINGVPVNDMENGWVYWSNWDGLGDAAQGIQLQRGLSAVNLATPSIGGTMNIITDPSSMRGGVSYKQEFGTAGFLKETFSVSSGEKSGFAMTANLVRKTGDGIFHGKDLSALATYTDAWAYYLAAAYQINAKNRLEFYAVGAPQAHGQNLYKLNVATMDQAFAKELGYEAAALAAFPEAGRFWSPNVASVNSSYAGKQYASTGPSWVTGTFDRYGSDFLNERENYFHKPQVNLNYYSYFGNGLTWSTVAYYSGGRGGGSGTIGSLVWDYSYTQRFANWDATIARNQTNATGSRGILRSSVNNQDTWGAISKLRKDYASGWTTEVGLDLRTAEISHYRDVRDLLGGAYYVDTRNQFTGPRNTGPGDRIDYSNTNSVKWLGAYVQAEKSSTDGSVYGMFGWAQNSYSYLDDFKKGSGPGGKLQLESGALRGYQVKGGVSRNLSDEWSLFGNAGYVSKVPIYDGAIDDVLGVVNPNPKNEKFVSVEGGVSFRAQDRGLSFDGNFYYTTWRDRTQNIYVANEDILVNVLGVDARHMGVEFQSAYQPNELVRFDAALSFGNWTYLDDAKGFAVSGDRQTSTEFAFYIKDLKVSDQPQTQFAYAASLYPVDGMFLQLQGRSNTNYYAAFSPFGRTDPTDRAQPWKTPGYTLFDFHGAYRISDLLPMWSGGDVRFFANVFNVFDALYIQDATDNSGFNGYHADGDRHDADSAEVYLGLPRMYNIGFQIIF
jgi:hypothetical protein